MKQILQNESVVQSLLHKLSPGLCSAGCWLGEAIDCAIDEIVDFLTGEEGEYE